MELIDREALKKAWIEECGGDCAICGYLITEKRKDGLTDWIGCELIENAPKIETFTFDDMNKAQEVGYKAGKLEGKSDRPRGEWIELDDYYCKCSNCEIIGVPEIGYANYCPNCGAKMKNSIDNLEANDET